MQIDRKEILLAVHEAWELAQMQSYPLDIKIKMTQQRIKAFVDEFGERNVRISFSGGKDSTVLLDIVRKLYPDMKAVYCDTGLEYPEIKEFVRKFDNVDIIRPKMAFKDVVSKYGYPVISKEISYRTHCARIAMAENRQNWAIKMFNGTYTYVDKHTGEVLKSDYCCERYNFLLDAPFKLHNKCCYAMKKNPLHDYDKEHNMYAITGVTAAESKQRKMQWLKYGCNIFTGNNPISKPLSIWVEQDILRYLYENKLPIASVYGDIVYDEKTEKFYTTGCDRTGCMFCGYGAHLDKRPNRFERLAVSHPPIYDFVMRGGTLPKMVSGNLHRKDSVSGLCLSGSICI